MCRQYLYCITDHPRFDIIPCQGILKKRPYFIRHKDIAAVVSDMDAPNLELTSATVLAHEHVAELLMKTHTVLPVRFGTVLGSDKDVREFLGRYYDSVVINIERVKDKVELGLKVLLKEMPESKEENDKECQIQGALTPAREYLKAKINEEKKQQKILEEAGSVIDEICLVLNAYADATSIRKLASDKMILNASFLVPLKSMETFTGSVEILKRRHPGLSFLYSGPWPPYNFVGLEERTESDA